MYNYTDEIETHTIIHVPPWMDEIYDLLGVEEKSLVKCDEIVTSLPKEEVKKLLSEKTSGQYIVSEKDNHLYILNMSA
jgi:hypothetical protein